MPVMGGLSGVSDLFESKGISAYQSNADIVGGTRQFDSGRYGSVRVVLTRRYTMYGNRSQRYDPVRQV